MMDDSYRLYGFGDDPLYRPQAAHLVDQDYGEIGFQLRDRFSWEVEEKATFEGNVWKPWHCEVIRYAV